MKRGIFILAFVVFLVMLGFGLVIPVLPYYSMSLGASSFDLGLLMGVYSLMQFLFAPLWGRLGDQKGRKPVLMTGIGGFAVSFALYGLADSFWLLFAFRALSGVFSSAAMPTAMAMVADNTTEKERGKYMGLIGAMTGLGMIFGPALGGLLAEHSHTLPFYAAAALALATFGLAGFILKESLSVKPHSSMAGPFSDEDNAMDQPEAKAKAWGRGKSLRQALKGSLAFLLLLNLILSFVNANLESTFAYLAADNYGLSPLHLGIAFMVMGSVSVVLQGGLLGRLLARHGEEILIKAGIAITAAGFLLIPLSGGVLALIAMLSVTAVGMGLMRPSLSSLVSKRTPSGQGLSMGILSSFDSLGRIMGPVVGGALYLVAHELPYWVSAAVLASVFALVVARPLLAGKNQREDTW